MRDLLFLIPAWLRSALRSRQDLALENLALRQQLMVLLRGQPVLSMNWIVADRP